MGAGGGFFMFYCQNGEKYMVTLALHKLGLRRERFKIDWDWARVMLNSIESSHST
jgi:galactokinase/mevalonate kinase-like predicted kinase